MKKNEISLPSLVEELVTKLNSEAKKQKTDKIYSVKIKNDTAPPTDNNTIKKGGTKSKGKSIRTLYFYLNDTLTGERVVLYKTSFIPNNPAELLRTPYKEYLYKNFLYNAIGVLAVYTENNIKENQLKEAAARATVNKIHNGN